MPNVPGILATAGELPEWAAATARSSDRRVIDNALVRRVRDLLDDVWRTTSLARADDSDALEFDH